MESTPVLASRWKRLGGALIDGLIGMAVAIPVMLVSGVFKSLTQGQPLTIGQTVFFLFFGMGAFLLINGYLLATQGQTVGKRLVGTRIVSLSDGQILSLGKVFGLRYLPVSVIAQIPYVGGLFSLVDTLFIFRKDKRCIHDLIAGTRVVDA